MSALLSDKSFVSEIKEPSSPAGKFRTADEIVQACSENTRVPEKADMYRFPWSHNDNPVGWVEVTDKCNIMCNGCYRLRKEGHKSLEAIKEELLFLIKWRKIDNVFIAGGEPLIHPNIVEIVEFINKQGLKATSLTNGHRLDEKLLFELKRAGLVELSFHIDSGQTRQGWTGKSEEELNELRQRFVDMLWKAKINCNFNMTVSLDNFHIAPQLVNFALQNRGKVQGLTFIVLRGVPPTGIDYSYDGTKIIPNSNEVGLVTNVNPENFKVKSTDVYRYLKTHFPEYDVSGYLGGTMTHDAYKWLIAKTICCDDEIIGAVSPLTMELAQMLHHLFTKKYLAGSRGKTGREFLLLAGFDRRIRKALGRLLLRPWRIFKPVYGMTIAIVQPCDFLPDGRVDMCESCPDITLYKGRLVSSCRLEEFRIYGDYITTRAAKENGNRRAAGGARNGQKRVGQERAGGARNGQKRVGQERASEGRNGQKRVGQERASEGRNGQKRVGQERAGRSKTRGL